MKEPQRASAEGNEGEGGTAEGPQVAGLRLLSVASGQMNNERVVESLGREGQSSRTEIEGVWVD